MTISCSVKVRIQTQVPDATGKLPYKGAIDCARQTLQREGPRGLYKGMSAPLAGVVPIFSLCFLSYDGASRGLNSRHVNKRPPRPSLPVPVQPPRRPSAAPTASALTTASPWRRSAWLAP